MTTGFREVWNFGQNLVFSLLIPLFYFSLIIPLYVVFCAIWYHPYNLKNVKNTHGGVLLLEKLQALA